LIDWIFYKHENYENPVGNDAFKRVAYLLEMEVNTNVVWSRVSGITSGKGGLINFKGHDGHGHDLKFLICPRATETLVTPLSPVESTFPYKIQVDYEL